jgi:hypothetical protein
MKLYLVGISCERRGKLGSLQTSRFKLLLSYAITDFKYDNKNLLNFRWQDERAMDRMSAFLHLRRSLLPCRS